MRDNILPVLHCLQVDAFVSSFVVVAAAAAAASVIVWKTEVFIPVCDQLTVI